MTAPATRARRAPGRGLKSPLAVPGASTATCGPLDPAPNRAVLSDGEATLAEFQGYLRTVNNRDGRPFEEKTITAYSDPAKSLDRWMTANGIDGDFTGVDTATLNRYFREYYLEHGQGRDAHSAAQPHPAVQLPRTRTWVRHPVQGRAQPVRGGQGTTEDAVR